MTSQNHSVSDGYTPDPSISSPTPAPVSLDEFLAHERCALPRLDLRISPDTTTLYIPWRHVSENVPAAVAMISDLLAARPDASEVHLITELVGRSSEEKEIYAGLAGIAINGDSERAAIALDALRSSSYLPKLEIDMIEGLRELVHRDVPPNGEPSHSITLHFMDMESKEAFEQVMNAKQQFTHWATAMVGMLSLSPSRLQEIGKITEHSSEEDRHREAGRFLDQLVNAFQYRSISAAVLLSPERNEMMKGQIADLRSAIGEETPIVVMMGGVHAELALERSRDAGVALQYAAIPDALLSSLPEGNRSATPLGYPDVLALKIAAGSDIAVDEVRRALFEALIEPHVAMRCHDGLEGKEHLFQDLEAVFYTTRALVTMTDPQEIEAMLDDWARDLFSVSASEEPCTELLGARVDVWLNERLGEPGKELPYHELLERVVDRYLAVDTHDA